MGRGAGVGRGEERVKRGPRVIGHLVGDSDIVKPFVR